MKDFDMDEGMSPRKQMAGGDMSGDFGCAKHDSYNKKHPEMDSDLHKRTMRDGDRHAPVSHSEGKAPAQRNPDHGRHDGAHGPDFGTKGMPR